MEQTLATVIRRSRIWTGQCVPLPTVPPTLLCWVRVRIPAWTRAGFEVALIH
jgi:hypothetical protein